MTANKIIYLIFSVVVFTSCFKKNESELLASSLYDYSMGFTNKQKYFFISRGSGFGIDLYDRGKFRFNTVDNQITLKMLFDSVESLDPDFYREFISGSKFSKVMIYNTESGENYLLGFVFNLESYNFLYRSALNQRDILQREIQHDMFLSEESLREAKAFSHSFFNEFLIIKFPNAEVFFIANPYTVNMLIF